MMPPNYDVIATQMPWWLVISCRNRWYLRNFVEGGAGYGHTSAVACCHFQTVWAIEMVPEVFNAQNAALVNDPKAKRLLGSTLDHLPSLAASIEGPTLWYLDSHWPGMGLKLGQECPLLDELAILANRQNISRDVCMIDNAGMFIHPPRPPHNPAEWPTIAEVRAALAASWPCTTLIADVLIATPEPIIANA